MQNTVPMHSTYDIHISKKLGSITNIFIKLKLICYDVSEIPGDKMALKSQNFHDSLTDYQTISPFII